eukprot:TRINITY_DN9360_c0_g1_i1.p1 TRINITY_DN9360_c0_g1~~TRINITY_DN9360_c0_g1_i1.p1  ORF type:complete len:446 (+),score=103.34 TRINITY_DN9360_c0_g1_i1:16-1353(+)
MWILKALGRKPSSSGNDDGKDKQPSTVRIVTAEQEDTGELLPEQQFEPMPVAVDDEGFVQSFTLDQTEEFKAFFDKYGFVVVNGVISDQDCDASVEEIWNEVKSFSKDLVNQEDADSWDFWPSKGAGILGDDIAAQTMAWKNRANPNLHKVFATLIGTPELLSSVDRYGIMRPTKDVLINGTKLDKPGWRTQEKWFHWDLNPWKWCKVRWPPVDPAIEQEIRTKLAAAWDDPGRATIMLITENNDNSDFKGYEKVQGLVAFTNSYENSGGFQTVPGFHNFLPQWAGQTRRYSKADFVSVRKEDTLVEHAQRISMRKGSLVVWSSRMPHCNYPNDSAGWRYNQYIKMFPSAVLPSSSSTPTGKREEAKEKDKDKEEEKEKEREDEEAKGKGEGKGGGKSEEDGVPEVWHKRSVAIARRLPEGFVEGGQVGDLGLCMLGQKLYPQVV